MSRVTYGSRGGRVRVSTDKGKAGPSRPAEDVVREIRATKHSGEEDYRERSLAIHGLICARCSREFDAAHRHLLTVHHRDGNHQNNPADGRNWENLCVYCHEDIHSRGFLGDYLEGTSVSREESVVYRDESNTGRKGLMTLGDQLKRALEKKKQQP